MKERALTVDWEKLGQDRYRQKYIEELTKWDEVTESCTVVMYENCGTIEWVYQKQWR